MDPAALVAIVQDAVPGVSLQTAPSVDPQITLFVERDDLPRLAPVLRDHPSLRFTLLAEVTAVDLWPREPRFQVVYLLVSIEHRIRLRLKVRLGGDDPHVATMSGVWPSANWLEREVWDLFGVAFDGHPDPRRLLMPEDWEGHPLRRDFPVQVRMPVRSSSALQVTEAEFRANMEKDRMTRPPK